jgi:hypothetical protein
VVLDSSAGARPPPQQEVAYSERGTEDFLAPFRLHLLTYGRFPMGHHRHNPPAETLLIKLKKRTRIVRHIGVEGSIAYALQDHFL